MKLIYDENTRAVVSICAPGSVSEHVLSWVDDVPQLASGFRAVDFMPTDEKLSGVLTYREDETLEKHPEPAKEDKVAALEAELLSLKSRVDVQDTQLVELNAKAVAFEVVK